MATGSLGDAFGYLIDKWTQAGLLTLDQWQVAQYLYHVTDVKHAVGILKSGELLSRNMVAKRGLIEEETGNQGILNAQVPWVRDCARLYFRPRTPALFHSEGIRPSFAYASGTCPLPICFRFDAREVMNREVLRYSNGNTAKSKFIPQTGSGIDGLSILDPLMYHEGPMPEHQKDAIRYLRHAEVMVFHRLSLNALMSITVRTSAEMETLISRLQDELAPEWAHFYENRIRVDNSCFINDWIRVDYCELNEKVHFHLSRGVCGPSGWRPEWSMEFSLEVTTDGQFIRQTQRLGMDRSPLLLTFDPLPIEIERIRRVRLYVDGQLAFQRNRSPAARSL